ncbi:PEP-CTERM sorting domain-containing protein [Methylophilus aquaticus]|uniref:Ice-binding protein C-terminal domain-containing protein n=1 Tax=Methylophilus aquaticus TaxID=1971610 RepID=A0ABT9JUG8_9PROT|nr:PEP-CTERM sorting domain-containing protein [Methylophilus aquaticus]MDP8567745.1 hypothetical protein [Methylophilus aquaticus]
MKIPESINTTNKYAYGTLLSLGAFFVSGNVDAAVVTSSSSSTLTGAGTLNVTNGVAVVNSVSNNGKASYSGSVKLDSPTGFVTTKLSAGTVIGAFMDPVFSSSNTIYAQSKSGKSASTVTTGSTGAGIYGFSFVNGGQTNYGWANISVSDNGSRDSYASLVATINSFAYTTAGEMIRAGTNHVYVAAVPEADTLAMLAAGIGLVGFSAKRRREKFLNIKQSNLQAA